MTQRILVLGANGFVGRRLMQRLAATPWAEPVGAGRRPGDSGSPHRYIRLDTTDARGLAAALAEVDAVVNCVSGAPSAIAEGARLLASTAAEGAATPALVHLSSLAVYGWQVGSVDESAALSGEQGAYAEAKVAAERHLSDRRRTTILRPGIIYGAGSPWWTESIGTLLRSRRLGDLGPAGTGICNLVHVDDVVTAIVSSLAAPAEPRRTFNLSTPAPVTWNDYFVRFATALGVTPVARISKARLLAEVRVVSPMVRIAEILLGRWPAARRALPVAARPWALPRLCGHDLYMRVDRIQRELDFHFTPLEDGLAATAAEILARS